MYRKRMKPRKDKKVFRSTAAKTKMVNLASSVQRGGIRF